MLRPLAFLSLLELLVPAATPTQVDLLSRFQLYNACRPMEVLVEAFAGNGESRIGLTRQGFELAAESRLRAARLYSEDHDESGGAYVYLRTTVVSSAFTVEVHYKKVVTDEFQIAAPASTWERGFSGTHGRDASYVMSSLSELLDEFLAAYLRVNEAACDD